MAIIGSEELSAQLGQQRRTVDFDTYDIQVQELLRQLFDGQISVAPVYQRQFRWDAVRCSQLVESLALGIPIPNLFMATNDDNNWEVVDGVQRLSAVAKFAGAPEVREKLGVGDKLVLEGLKKLSQFNGLTFDELPPHLQQHIRTRPLRIVTLNDKADKRLRIDLFERLNTGGIALTKQEIRDCVFYGPFADLLESLAKNPDCHAVVRLTSKQEGDGTREECVLRFFAFLDRYRVFDHSVEEFLNNYMQHGAEKLSDGEMHARRLEFGRVFAALAAAFPRGILRPGGKGTTPLNLFEGVAVGAALAMRKSGALQTAGVMEWMASPELRKSTTGATNSRPAVRHRIEFCRDRFLGLPYVPAAAD